MKKTRFNELHHKMGAKMVDFGGWHMPLQYRTGIVEEHAELLEITAADFGQLLDRNPGIAETIAGLVSDRNRKNAEFLSKIKDLSAKDVEDSGNKNWILARLRKLVSLFHKAE